MNEYASSTPGGGNGLYASSSRTAIEIENLTVNYGASKVLKGVNLEVPAGSIFGFLGANGAGKTTTITTLLGFRPPASGSARVLGYDVVRQHREICTHVGYVSEADSLYGFLNIAQLCNLSRDLHQRWNQETVDHYLQLFELPTNKRIREFSRGMKSQLALCLALGNDPDLLILDEPTTGLDPVARELFLSTIIKDVAAAGKTVFFSSHILSEVEAIADQIAVLHQGTIVLNDELDHLRERQKLLLLTYADQPPPEELAALCGLAGVRQFEQEGRTVRLRVEGDADGLVENIRARPYALLNLDVIAVRLEDVLLEYIRGDGR